MSGVLTGGVLDGTWGLKGGSDLSTGAAGMSCGMGPLAPPVDVLGGVFWTLGTSHVVGEGQVKPGIDLFTPYPS